MNFEDLSFEFSEEQDEDKPALSARNPNAQDPITEDFMKRDTISWRNMSKSKLFTPSIDIDYTPDVKNQLRSAAPMMT